MIWLVVGAFVFGVAFAAAGWYARGWVDGSPRARHRSGRRWFPPEQPETRGLDSFDVPPPRGMPADPVEPVGTASAFLVIPPPTDFED